MVIKGQKKLFFSLIRKLVYLNNFLTYMRHYSGFNLLDSFLVVIVSYLLMFYQILGHNWGKGGSDRVLDSF